MKTPKIIECDIIIKRQRSEQKAIAQRSVENHIHNHDNSLVEMVLNLSPEEQKVFLEKLNNQHLTLGTSKPQTSEERLLLWQEWIDTAPKSYANLSDEVLRRENIYFA